MSQALYWGLPAIGTCVRRCAVCKSSVLVACDYRVPTIGLFDPPEDGERGNRLHYCQPHKKWIEEWAFYTRKHRSRHISGSIHGGRSSDTSRSMTIPAVYDSDDRKIPAPLCNVGENYL